MLKDLPQADAMRFLHFTLLFLELRPYLYHFWLFGRFGAFCGFT